VKTRPYALWFTLVLLMVLAVPQAVAEVEVCEDVLEVDRFHLQRQLSLDLHGVVPSVQELQPLIDGAEPDVEAMVDDEAFYRFVRRHHADMLWPNIDAFQLVNPAFSLLLPASFYEYMGSGNEDRLFVLYVGLYRRGALVPCKDEPAVFDDYGEPIAELYPDGTTREGWVEIEPYWAPGTTVKVCAYEAEAGMEAYGSGLPCDSYQGMLTGQCGCGPDLQRCLSVDAAPKIVQGLADQLLGAIEEPIREGRSYYDALVGTTERVNGPLTHYYRYLVPMAVDPLILYSPVDTSSLPEIPFTDTQWVEVDRGAPHSGILTSLLYLLRFQTSRARASRFWEAFLCAPFEAGEIPLPSPDDPCSAEPNLRARCGCKGCHASLEPASAYWASFVDAGAMWLDPQIFPYFDSDCAGCQGNPFGCGLFCDRLYLTEAGHPDEAPYVGYLRALTFRDGPELDRYQDGPSALVESYLSTGLLQRCTARRVGERLLGRALSSEESDTLLAPWTEAFEASGHDFKTLVKAIVSDPAYRRIAR
jgi:hypothetical protein